jgi:uncharacterized MAPEG superfamily protein
MVDPSPSLPAAITATVSHSAELSRQEGNQYTMGPRDKDLNRTGVVGRLDRAQKNFFETFGIFAVCVLLVHLTAIYGSLRYWGSILYLVGRVLYLPLYALGVPWLRSFSRNLATLGPVLAGAQVVAGNA